jgi:hypothetical protein
MRQDEYRGLSSQGHDSRKVSSLRELPQGFLPARDLWPQLEARLAEAPTTASPRARAASLLRRGPLTAAAIGLLALGTVVATAVWLLHGPLTTGSLQRNFAASLNAPPLVDPDYVRQREALMRSLNARLAALPPVSRQKVLADLNLIEQSLRDIQQALGRDPDNALLRQLLLETYQDERHLFDTVQEADAWAQQAGGKGDI